MSKCENCEIEHEGKYGSGRFCSSKCARGFSTKEKRSLINEKVRSKLLKTETGFVTNICIECNESFLIKYKKRNQKCCSRSCSSINFSKSEKGIAHHKAIGIKSSLSQNKRSKNEKAFAELCIGYFKNVECNKGIFNGWDADVIIHDLKVAVLWNGKWHYEKLNKKHSVSQVQNRDKIKIKEIIKYGYTPYIIKDLGKFDLNKVNLEWNIFLNYIK